MGRGRKRVTERKRRHELKNALPRQTQLNCDRLWRSEKRWCKVWDRKQYEIRWKTGRKMGAGSELTSISVDQWMGVFRERRNRHMQLPTQDPPPKADVDAQRIWQWNYQCCQRQLPVTSPIELLYLFWVRTQVGSLPYKHLRKLDFKTRSTNTQK